MLSLIRGAFGVLSALNPFSGRATIVIVLVNFLLKLMVLFVLVSIAALCFRWANSLTIEILGWVRQVLNHVASLYPGTSG